MSIQQKIENIMEKQNSLVCVGLDSEFKKLPVFLQKEEHPQFEFNRAIINATHEFVCAYKLNTAFYEARGEQGIRELKMTCDYLHQNFPEIVSILDAKRADIGNTNEGYVQFAYEYLGCDAITLHPYLGSEALQPFLEFSDKAAIILCRTSNSGSGEFQSLNVDGEPLYQTVAKKVSRDWNKNNNCWLVVGATYSEEMKKIRELVGDMILLVPGIGAQGGDIQATLEAGLNANKKGLILSSSRAILFVSSGEDFAERAGQETLNLRDEINTWRH